MKPRHRPVLISLIALIALVALVAQLPAQTSASEDTVIFDVSGMRDQGCEEYVTETLLGDIDGVRTATADAENGAVSVTFDSAITDPNALAEAIEKCQHLEVEGSTTHDLAERSSRQDSCCNVSSCQIGDKNTA